MNYLANHCGEVDLKFLLFSFPACSSLAELILICVVARIISSNRYVPSVLGQEIFVRIGETLFSQVICCDREPLYRPWHVLATNS